MAKRAPGPYPGPNDVAGWQAVDKKLELQARSNVEQAIARDHITVAATKLGSVPVLDVRPQGWTDDRRIIVYFHGGGYTMFSARTSIALSGAMSAATGERIVSVEYTLAPAARWQTIQRQALDVVKALLSRGYRLRNIAVAGDSAGGGLAVSTVLNLRDAGIGMPGAAVLISPWVDLTDNGDTMHTLSGEDPIVTYLGWLKNAAGAYAGTTSVDDPHVSPIYADFSKGFCRTLIQDATKTILESGSVRLYRALDAAGADVKLDMYEGMWHDFPWWADVPESQLAFKKIAAFLKR